MANRVYLAIDMGASSGRHVAGLFDGATIRLANVYRFENGAIQAGGHLYWDVLGQWQQIRLGLRAAATQYGTAIASIGVDTWGVDFALLGRGDELLGNPYNYRDARTCGMIEQAEQEVSRAEIFEATGVQFMQLNTLYQLLAMRVHKSPILDVAESLLMMPDLFHWLLTGVKANEFTDATTTQFYDPRRKTWAFDLLERLELPTHILGEIRQPGTNLGMLRAEVAGEADLREVSVVLPGAHDTASAVMAVPAEATAGQRPTWCYISSGTWSLMGVETHEPVINAKALELNFTNEGGVGGTIRVLKNIAGLWLVQECRRIWNQAGKNYSFDDLSRMADASPALVSWINPDDASFLAPAHMPRAMQEFCQRTGQKVPETEGALVRCAIESLALRYRQVLNWLEELLGGRLETIHVVGGGAQDAQLCQATADACDRPVVAGPVEATALGNVLMQAIAGGDVASIDQAREIVRRSFEVQQYEPRDRGAWDDAYARFVQIQKQ